MRTSPGNSKIDTLVGLSVVSLNRTLRIDLTRKNPIKLTHLRGLIQIHLYAKMLKTQCKAYRQLNVINHAGAI